MPNPIKYNVSAETLSLKKGNFWIGTGDVGKGPTNTTGYYNGITPPVGGYTIYLNKATGGPSIYVAANDSELISLTNIIASTSYTTVGQCFTYYSVQSDKMVLNRDYEPIVTNGLILNLDAGFISSYPTVGTDWYDISGNNNHCTLYNGATYNNGTITLDGVNDYIKTNNTLDLTSTNAVTVLYFLQPTTYGTSVKIIHELSTDFNSRLDSFVAAFSDNSVGQNFEILASVKGDVGYNIASYNKTMLNDLGWHQHTIIHNTGQSLTEVLMYGNGQPGTVLQNPVPGYNSNNTNNFGNQPFYIGSRSGSSLFATIKIGQVLMYNRAL
jgi:hypothetical protein